MIYLLCFVFLLYCYQDDCITSSTVFLSQPRQVTSAGCTPHCRLGSQNLSWHFGPELYFIHLLSPQPYSISGVLRGDWDPVFFHPTFPFFYSTQANMRHYRSQEMEDSAPPQQSRGLKLPDRLGPALEGHNNPLRDWKYWCEEVQVNIRVHPAVTPVCGPCCHWQMTCVIAHNEGWEVQAGQKVQGLRWSPKESKPAYSCLI